jgi:hypothetical protein
MIDLIKIFLFSASALRGIACCVTHFNVQNFIQQASSHEHELGTQDQSL